MSLRTPLARVKGLGAAGEGVGHWWLQRLTAIFLLPLSFYMAIAVLRLPRADYTSVISCIEQPCTKVIIAMFVVIGFIHAALGLQVIIEDYIHRYAVRMGLILTMKFVFTATALAILFALIKL